MNNFEFTRTTSVKAALDAKARDASSTFIAGGTNLVDLMKRGVTSPGRLIDINSLPLNFIEESTSSTSPGVRIGALAINSELSEHKLIRERYPLLSHALKAGASPQLRNMATVGGNIMQRTRCTYFYDTAMPCNKRNSGSGCSALKGYNRMHAILGANDKCIAVHPSDMCVALAALDATIHLVGQSGERHIPFTDFHRLPGDDPSRDNNLGKGELIEAVFIPENPFHKNFSYLKIRDRASYAFALISVAAALEMSGKKIVQARIALGGVAHKPWRMKEVEKFLEGKSFTAETIRNAAALSTKGAKGYGQNNFKLKLMPTSIMQALVAAGERTQTN